MPESETLQPESVTQFAERNGLDRSTVIDAINAGKIRAQKVGNYYSIEPGQSYRRMESKVRTPKP
jgi:hypothetical protein